MSRDECQETNPLTCSWVMPPAMENPRCDSRAFVNSISSTEIGAKRRISCAKETTIFSDQQCFVNERDEHPVRLI